ncbi:hypothetical protein [Actinomadura sp. WMMB 499]|uniref:hypothetical protein n=1 Tax=Actinomadura sp. WMMB 499 TaxID=1219491 RepID=UPI001248709A|nr:hypothetical protein [Actinomadura sp. WMMB 499]QFG24506.1 hypothetical protein F7P10_28630 [Actinomadura sp. WMMB 499]
MVFCDYFAAPDDLAAVAVLDEPGGPGAAAFDAVPLKGVDPVVVIARLEAILTGCTYGEAAERPRSGTLLSPPDAESAFVVAVTDTLRDALASAAEAALREAGPAWAGTDEMRADGVSAEGATEAAMLLADLARRATSNGMRLYCWWAL